MEYKAAGEHDFLIRLDPGESVISALTELAEKQGWNSGFIFAIGSVRNPELGYYSMNEKKYYKQLFTGDFEVVHLAGNLTRVGDKAFFHLHTILSDEHYQTIAGHLFEASVSGTLECSLRTSKLSVTRKLHPETGLNVWKFDEME